MELSYATNSLGSLAMQRQQFDIARKNFEESLRLRLVLQQHQADNEQLRADIANARSWLASAALAEGNVHRAIEIHRKLQAELISSRTKHEPYLLDILSSSYQKLADLLIYQGKITEAQITSLQGEQALSQAIEQDPENSRWQRNRYFLYFQKFNVNPSSSAAEIERELSLLTDALEAQKNVLSNTNRKDILARLWLSTAAQLQDIDQFSLSAKYADLAYVSFAELAEDFKLNRNFIGALSDSQILKARAAKAADRPEVATDLCRQVKDRLATIVTQNKEPRYVIAYAKSLDCLGELNNSPEIITTLQQNGLVNYHFLSQP
jgi:tetratricopeptide (TPR) repeat protein